MRPDVKSDYEWARQFEPEACEILSREILAKVTRFIVSSFEEDTKQATDLVPYAETDKGAVGLRIRRPQYIRYRDITFRSWRSSGAKTERDKIIAGWGKFNLYIWTNAKEGVARWVIVNLDRIREQRILERKSTKKNDDGLTGFVAIAIPELISSGSIEAEYKLRFAIECRHCDEGLAFGDAVSDGVLGYSCMRCAMLAQAEDDKRRWERANREFGENRGERASRRE